METQDGKNTKYLPIGTTSYAVDSKDDFILVDTSVGPVSIYLPNIVGSGILFKPKRFYIGDNSSNAGTNNITIFPTGSNQVNSGASVVLSTNGATCECVIASQTEYLINKDSAQSGGVTGSGTAGKIAMFTGTSVIGNSIITQTASAISIAGTLAVTNFLVDNVAANSMSINSRIAYDSTGTASVDWTNRILISPNSTTIFSWANTGATINNGSLTLAASSTVYSSLTFTASAASPSAPVNGQAWYDSGLDGITFWNDGSVTNTMTWSSTTIKGFAGISAGKFSFGTTTNHDLLFVTNNSSFALNLSKTNGRATFNAGVSNSETGQLNVLAGGATNTFVCRNGADNTSIFAVTNNGNIVAAPVATATGAVTAFSFTAPNNTAQTLSTAIPKVLYTMGSQQWATGALAATQPFFSITQPTIAFVGSSTATLTATFSIAGAPTSGTNAIQTTSVGLLIQSAAVNSVGSVGTSYGIFSNAMTGATTNFAAGFSGTVQITGGLTVNYVTKTGNYTLTATDYTVDCTSSTFTVTLPTAVGKTGQIYVVKNTGIGVITIATTSSQTIDGSAPSQTLTTNQSYTFQSTNTNWIII